MREIPVGALAVRPAAINTVRLALLKLKWMRRGVNITPYAHQGPQGEGDEEPSEHEVDPSWAEFERAIHLTAAAAAAVEEQVSAPNGGSSIPDAIAEMLANDTVRWLPGMRVRSASCYGNPLSNRAGGQGGGQGSGQRGRDGAQAQAHDDRKAAVESSPAAPFTFIELFAGIGGFRVGLEALGGRCVFASEMDREAQDLYKTNFGDEPCGGQWRDSCALRHHASTTSF